MDMSKELAELIHNMTDEQFTAFKHICNQLKNAHTGRQSDTGKECSIQRHVWQLIYNTQDQVYCTPHSPICQQYNFKE
jgi:hypothetical protein